MSAPDAEASTAIAAPATAVYELVSDITRMGEWSPECRTCEWVGEQRGGVGARFEGHNQLGWRKWSTHAEVVEAEPGKAFAFQVSSVFGLPVAVWRYEMRPDGDGCVVTESTVDQRNGAMKFLGMLATGVTDRASHNRAGMEQTLQRIKAAAEGASGS